MYLIKLLCAWCSRWGMIYYCIDVICIKSYDCNPIPSQSGQVMSIMLQWDRLKHICISIKNVNVAWCNSHHWNCCNWNCCKCNNKSDDESWKIFERIVILTSSRFSLKQKLACHVRFFKFWGRVFHRICTDSDTPHPPIRPN